MHDQRIALQVKEEQDMMLGIAWVIPVKSDYFRLFPEVVFVDCIEEVNMDSRALFTASGKDANGNIFIILRAYLQNQQAWVFRWVFSVVFAKLFHKDILAKVNLFISDGNQEEMTQIDAAIMNVFPNAKRQRCGFHIVRMGWNHHILSKRCFEGYETL